MKQTPIIVALLLVAFVAGCKTYDREAGTGDLAFRLAWEGVSDLDLLVEDPAGDCIFFVKRSSESGGELDVDCSSGTDRMCAEPVENVFWPPKTAPEGTYRFWVHSHSLLPAEAPLVFQLQILHDVEPAWTVRRKIREQDEVYGPFMYSYPGLKVSGPVDDASDRPQCIEVIHLRRRRPAGLD